MISNNTIVAGDGHFHLYPCYEPARTINALINNLNLLVESMRGFGSGRNVFKVAFLTEGRQCNYFQKILEKEIGFAPVGLEVGTGPEEHCLSFTRDGKLLLVLVAGRQIATAERLEVLGLGMSEKIPDGITAEEAIEKIISIGGLPVLAFSPGKWLFKREKVVRQLAEKYGGKLTIGDSALRPLGWGEPDSMRRAREINQAVLPGSDPLPLPGEEKYAGGYGFVYQGLFDTSKPLASIKEIIVNHPEAILPAGRRCSALNVAGRLFRLRRSK